MARHCGRCGITLTNINSYRRVAGGFVGYCKSCNKDVTFIQAHKKDSIYKIKADIADYKRRIRLLHKIRRDKIPSDIVNGKVHDKLLRETIDALRKAHNLYCSFDVMQNLNDDELEDSKFITNVLAKCNALKGKMAVDDMKIKGSQNYSFDNGIKVGNKWWFNGDKGIDEYDDEFIFVYDTENARWCIDYPDGDTYYGANMIDRLVNAKRIGNIYEGAKEK